MSGAQYPLLAAGIIVLLLILFLSSSVKIVQEYERGVIFRLGRCVGAKGPGVFFIIPIFDKIIRTNLQIIVAPVAPQAVITKDNVTVRVDAVAYFQVMDAAASVVNIRDWYGSAQLAAQTSLRSIVGRHELDELLSQRERIDSELAIALDQQTEAWGVKVHRVEIRDVGLPDTMQRAMAKQAEAERERRAKIIAAEGELQASVKLGEAANVIAASPGALQLRQLQTMAEISAENNSTIVFPIPIEILEAFNSITAIGRSFVPNTPAPSAPAAPAVAAATTPAATTPVATYADTYPTTTMGTYDPAAYPVDPAQTPPAPPPPAPPAS